MALSATQVIQTFDYYSSKILLPGYTALGYESEQGIAKADYSTGFSSNPIGSKIDLFNRLNDPCLAVYAPNPVFSINKSLSALDPQWFNGWWDNAMFYSHPSVTSQLKLDSPGVYQDFSDSVGTLTYAPETDDPTDPTYGNDAVSPSISHKIPNRLLSVMKGLNSSIQTNFNGYTPANFGPLKGTFLQQVNAIKGIAGSLQSTITSDVGALKNKLPFSTHITGNLVVPSSWSHTYNIEGLSSIVDKTNNIIKAPGRLLSDAMIKVQNLIPKVTLPSISKLVGAYVPDMPAVSNVIGNIQAASTLAKSVVSTAQGALAATNTIASSVGNITATVGTVAATTLSIKSTADVQNLNKIVTQNGVTSALTQQSESTLSSLTNNSAVVINSGNISNTGNSSVLNINTMKYPT